mmetsp:Transcript_37263/g.60050  ORF Transcript_37263/g.60050 Transcript_37263/m.60050 type:complete len:484 (-) Transcript_37263:30-1481(-)
MGAEQEQKVATEHDEEDDNEGVQEHLKDAVEGTLRLKRMLSNDVDSGSSKKRKVEERCGPAQAAKIQHLLMKWTSTDDPVTKHVLEGITLEECELLDTNNFTPDKYNMWKSPAELTAMHVSQMRERSSAGGGPLDTIAAFRFRSKLDATSDALLRKLSHKDLRYVFENFVIGKDLAELMEEASKSDPQEGVAVGSAPTAPGCKAVGRFHRLELIDPMADAAVFGDANLGFALNLAKHRKALGHVGRVIATTFESLDVLRERYKEIDETIAELEEMFAEVYHEIDCTRIAVNEKFKGLEGSLGAVYYNFPHAGAVSGFFDGHPLVNWRHENLMRLFFRNLRYFVKPGGIVKVASNMGAVGVRYSYIVGSAIENEFNHAETVPFLEWTLRRYGRAYGDRRDAYKRPDKGEGYNVQRAEGDMVYTFTYAPVCEAIAQQTVRLPPTFKTIEACPDGPFSSLTGESRKNLAKQLYKRFVLECGGTHVG